VATDEEPAQHRPAASVCLEQVGLRPWQAATSYATEPVEWHVFKQFVLRLLGASRLAQAHARWLGFALQPAWWLYPTPQSHRRDTLVKRLLRAARRALPGSKNHVLFSGSILPAPTDRFCGPEFRQDSFYLQSAEAEARRLVTQLSCDRDTRILDIGCGQGRLPIGILRVIGELSYIGIDVDRRSIEWCRKHIERKHPSFQFRLIDVVNERYNRKGAVLEREFRFGLPNKSIDIIYLYSVFSHMREEHMRIYLSDFMRILADTGRVFFTTFVEEGVPEVSINPDNYVLDRYSGPLHVVRYEKDYLFSILDGTGFAVGNFSHRTEADGQSAIYLSKK